MPSMVFSFAGRFEFVAPRSQSLAVTRTALCLLSLGLVLLPSGVALAKPKKKTEEAKVEPAESEPVPAAKPPIAEENTSSDASGSSTSDSSAAPPASEAEGAAPAESKDLAAKAPERATVVFLEGGFRHDAGTFSRNESVGQNVDNQNSDISQWGPMLHLGLMSRRSETFAVGGAFGYAGDYQADNGGGEQLGQLMSLDFRMDFSTQATQEIRLFLAPRVGGTLLIPGGDLQARIDENQRFGYDTWSGPRLGFLVGFDAGARYALSDWISLRGSVGYAWGMQFLLASGAQGELVSASQTWQTQASRVVAAVGVEVGF